MNPKEERLQAAVTHAVGCLEAAIENEYGFPNGLTDKARTKVREIVEMDVRTTIFRGME